MLQTWRVLSKTGLSNTGRCVENNIMHNAAVVYSIPKMLEDAIYFKTHKAFVLFPTITSPFNPSAPL